MPTPSTRAWPGKRLWIGMSCATPRLSVHADVTLGVGMRGTAPVRPTRTTRSSASSAALRFTLEQSLGFFGEVGAGVSFVKPLYHPNHKQFSTVFNFVEHVGIGLRPGSRRGDRPARPALFEREHQASEPGREFRPAAMEHGDIARPSARNITVSSPHTTAFVLAGGGSLGAIEVGMMHELLAWGETPSFVVGASAGAINGAYLAAAPTPAGVSKLEAIWLGLKRQDLFPFNLGVSWACATCPSGRLPRPEASARATPPVCAARGGGGPDSHRRVGHGDRRGGRAFRAVRRWMRYWPAPRSRACIRRCLGGRLLVDGGVSNNTPISTAMRLGATRIIVLPTGFACALKAVPPSAIGRAMHALSLLVARQLVHDAERSASSVELRIVPTLCPLDCSPYDYSSAATLIQRAAESTRLWLAQGGLDQPGTPHELEPHVH